MKTLRLLFAAILILSANQISAENNNNSKPKKALQIKQVKSKRNFKKFKTRKIFKSKKVKIKSNK
jgi:hypothetical protein